jgi:hypothetical protein
LDFSTTTRFCPCCWCCGEGLCSLATVSAGNHHGFAFFLDLRSVDAVFASVSRCILFRFFVGEIRIEIKKMGLTRMRAQCGLRRGDIVDKKRKMRGIRMLDIK